MSALGERPGEDFGKLCQREQDGLGSEIRRLVQTVRFCCLFSSRIQIDSSPFKNLFKAVSIQNGNMELSNVGVETITIPFSLRALLLV